VGFKWAYDVACPALAMIIDCEPIYFSDAGKDWMIELWKGQYGLETGAEIGVYNTASNPAPIRAVAELVRSWFPEVGAIADSAAETATFYHCASDHDQLMMRFRLKREGVVLFERGPEAHWWLTGFKWGEFTESPAQLTVEAEITFPRRTMLDAFVTALKRPHRIVNLTVSFTFDKPHVTQPGTRAAAAPKVQPVNRALVDRYRDLKRQIGMRNNDPNGIDGSALSGEAKATYDAIMAFFAGQAGAQSRKQEFMRKVQAASA
jgi:hypothetical protein